MDELVEHGYTARGMPCVTIKGTRGRRVMFTFHANGKVQQVRELGLYHEWTPVTDLAAAIIEAWVWVGRADLVAQALTC